MRYFALVFLTCVFSKAQAPVAAESRLRALQDNAASALAQGDSSAALAALDEGLKLKADWKEGLWSKGWTLFGLKRYEAARPVLVSLLRLDQSKGAPWLLLGLCEFEARDYGMALADLQQGRALGIPANLGIAQAVRYHIAAGLALTGKFEAALELLDEAARTNEHTDEIVLATGLAAMRLPLLREQAQTLPAAYLAMLRRVGEALFQGARQNRSETDRIFQDLFKQWPALPHLHHAYGYFLLGAGDFVKADSEFKAELEVDPASALARCGRAHLALERGDATAAESLAREAVRRDPDSAVPHFLLGRALLRLEHAPEAITELEVARDLEPANSKVRFVLLQAYRDANRTSDAAREAREFERLKRLETDLKTRGHAPSTLLEPRRKP